MAPFPIFLSLNACSFLCPFFPISIICPWWAMCFTHLRDFYRNIGEIAFGLAFLSYTMLPDSHLSTHHHTLSLCSYTPRTRQTVTTVTLFSQVTIFFLKILQTTANSIGMLPDKVCVLNFPFLHFYNCSLSAHVHTWTEKQQQLIRNTSQKCETDISLLALPHN